MAKKGQSSELNSNWFPVLAFRQVDQVEVPRLCESLVKGHELFKEGSAPRGVYAINRGKVKVYRLGKDGKEQIIHLARQGDLLGYRTLISGDQFPVGASTLEATDLCFIPATEFHAVLDASPELHRKLLQQACRELGYMTGALTDLAQKTTRERLLLTLDRLCDIYDDSRDDQQRVSINLTREDLANIVGTATESLIRSLKELKKEGLIVTQGRRIVVPRREALLVE